MSNHFFAYLSRMKYIDRWSLMRNTRNENLSEHSLEAAVIAHALCVIANTYFGADLNPERAAAIALFHDASEIITGDMPTPIKYYNPDISRAYKDIEHIAKDKLISMLPPEMAGEYRGLFYKRVHKVRGGEEGGKPRVRARLRVDIRNHSKDRRPRGKLFPQ